ncbi:MAG: asparagine synthase (glutamine-hydrolyzing) [Phycisphaerales bacterium]|nr:asparagine synthase (glutamine-hydrolyzing) [Phycisphaerales bacterium]
MCGIGGILRVHQPGGDIPPPEVSIPEAWLDILDRSVRHRGPDGQGRFRDRVIRHDGSVVDVALIHRRLSIIDHAGGAQPMVSPARAEPGGPATPGAPAFCGMPLPVLFHGGPDDEVRYRPIAGAGSDLVTVVFNGCIYNHRELRKELQVRGHEFVTDHSDTEVLIHGWREWGSGRTSKPGLSDRLDGMFAHAVWDRCTGSLVLARDRFGEKPLYFTTLVPTRHGSHDDDPRAGSLDLAFSSDVTGLAQIVQHLRPWVGAFDRHREVIPWIHRGYATDPPIAGVRSLQPSRELVHPPTPQLYDPWPGRHYDRAQSRVIDVQHVGPVNADSIEGYLATAVHSRMESDVPLGCFLSGGIDSSLVAAFAARARGDLATFCIRMPDARYDESDWAEKVAGHLGTRHVTLPCELNPAADLQSLILTSGVPLGDSSLLPTHWLCRAVRKFCKVALSGDGADELFFGYERYVAAEWVRQHVRLLTLGSGVPWPDRHPKSRVSKLHRLTAALQRGGQDDLGSIFPVALLDELISPALASDAPGNWGEWSADRLRSDDIESYLPDDILRKVDTASMAVALESRAPFLEPSLAKLAVSLSSSALMPHGERKGLLKQVSRKYLPADIVDRPKMGFAIPIGEWFRSDYGRMRQLLLDHLTGPEPFGPDSLGLNGMINMDFVRRMLREHDEAGRASLWPWKGRDHSQRLYMLLVLSIWAKWLGGLK